MSERGKTLNRILERRVKSEGSDAQRTRWRGDTAGCHCPGLGHLFSSNQNRVPLPSSDSTPSLPPMR